MTAEFQTLVAGLVVVLLAASAVVFLIGLAERRCRLERFDDQSLSGYFYTFMLLLLAGVTVMAVTGL